MPKQSYRFVTETETGWTVDIALEHVTVRNFFPFSEYGSKSAAKRAAVEYRNSMLKALGVTTEKKLRPSHYLRYKNKAFVGVILAKRDDYYRLSYSWKAEYMEDGFQRKRAFSIAKYGYKEAFNLALELRCEKTGVPYQPTEPPPPPPEVMAWMEKKGLVYEPPAVDEAGAADGGKAESECGSETAQV